jgi:pyrroloquinoline quinone (PQQ) biosynthesis protein C
VAVVGWQWFGRQWMRAVAAVRMVVESAGGVGYWQRYGGGMGVGEKKMMEKKR